MYKYIDWSTVGILGQYICEQRYPDTCIYTCNIQNDEHGHCLSDLEHTIYSLQ